LTFVAFVVEGSFDMTAYLKEMVKGRELAEAHDFAEAHDIVAERALQESKSGFWWVGILESQVPNPQRLRTPESPAEEELPKNLNSERNCPVSDCFHSAENGMVEIS